MSFLNRVQEFSENAFSLTDLSEADKMRILAGLDQRSGAIGNSGINGLGDSEEEREKKKHESSMRDFVTSELERIQQQLDDLDKKIEQAEIDIARLNQEIADLRKDILDLQLEDARLAAEQRRLEEEAQDIREELDDLRPRVASAQKTTENAEAALSLAIANDAPPEEIEHLTRIHAEALREQQELEAQQAEREATLQEKLDAATSIAERRQIIAETLEERHAELEDKLAQRRERQAELDGFRADRAELVEQELAELEREQAELQEEITSLEQEQEAIQTMIVRNEAGMESELNLRFERIEQLSKENTDLSSALTSFNEKSLRPAPNSLESAEPEPDQVAEATPLVKPQTYELDVNAL